MNEWINKLKKNLHQLIPLGVRHGSEAEISLLQTQSIEAVLNGLVWFSSALLLINHCRLFNAKPIFIHIEQF